VWILVALAVVKIGHELAHAAACKHFGGECHEMGLMLLVFTPCLYCNVSDAWMLPSKWHRAAVGAAGMYLEVVLAAACTFLWWFSTPGLFNTICLNTMFVCSVGTLLFNGNPLLRYDGYYIISELFEVPNLHRQAW
ncbi:MAG: hemolysin D, partial [Planctomycetaceae bacterium]